MKTMIRSFSHCLTTGIALVTLVTLTLGATPALAADATTTSETATPPPATKEAESTPGFSASALFGAGFNSSKIQTDGGTDLDQSVGLYGLGLGARLGYTLTSRIYVGGTIVYHLGQTKDDKGVKYEGGVLYPGVEAGYELGVGPVLLRPYAGVGYVAVKLKASAGPSELDASASKLGFWPGATVIYPMERYFLGVDLRYVIVPSVDRGGNANALSFFGTGGVHF
jgi:hypothetical protein